jgi:hypothetical protein
LTPSVFGGRRYAAWQETLNVMKKRILVSALSLVISASAFAQTLFKPPDSGGSSGGGTIPNLTYHGGPVIQNAKLVYIFWGWSSSGAVGSGEFTSELIGFRQYGMPGHLGMLDQYNATQSAGLLNSGVPDVFDPVAPPPSISDADVQHEVQKYFHDQVDPYTIYMVVLPSGVTVTAPNGTDRSCSVSGGKFCGYHWHFWDNGTYGSTDARYGVIAYPECSVCHPSGWSDAMATEMWVLHEGREAMTDPHIDAWYDSVGQEADDKCSNLPFTQFAPKPPPYYSGFFTFGYQQEWSNADRRCVQ